MNFYNEHIDIIHNEAVKLAPTLFKLKTLSGIKNYYKGLYQRVDKIQEEVGFYNEIQCTKQSCSFCCFDRIMGSSDEIQNIVDNTKWYNTKLNQTKDNWDSLKFAEKACPMLKDGKCTIYEDRPLICRSHNIRLGEDIEKCKRQNGEYTEEVKIINVEAILLADTMIAGKVDCLNYHILSGESSAVSVYEMGELLNLK